MTYSPHSSGNKLEVAIFQWSSGGSQGSACPLTLINHNWDVAPVINGTGDGLTLPSGCYRAMATVYATRSNTDENIQFIFQVDSTSIGMFGQTDLYQNSGNVDQADCTFTLTSTATLELMISAIETGIPTLTSDCRLVLWRTSI